MKKITPAPQSARKNVSPAQNQQYASVLKRMVDCKTVWTKDNENKAQYEAFYRVVAESFPTLHSRAQRLTFGDGCFFYVIEGKNPSRHILLMSHHDVVDAGEGWNSDPFCAQIKDGALWGRGTVDTKTPLFAELQAAEELLLEGYDFEGMTLYIGSSHNEEVSGDGMVLAADYFRQKGIRFDAILDEGGAITAGMIPGAKVKSAVVAVHEKGRHLYRCTVREHTQGHGGLNPKAGSPVASLSEFVTRVSSSGIFKASVAPEVKATFTRHAPYMTGLMKLLFSHFDLFSPVIKKIMMKRPQSAAMLSTGVTFTTFHAGSEDSPQTKASQAQVHMFLRCVREEDLYRELEQVKAIAADCGVEIEEIMRDYCRPTDFTQRPFRVLEQVLHQNFPDVVVAPFLLTAGTDARRFSDLADSILRFAPIDLNGQQFASIHGKNENITIENLGQCVLFYKDFVRQI